MELKNLILISLIIGESFCNQLKLFNKCTFSVWPGIQGISGYHHLENGGFKLEKYESKFINTPGDWAGRVWARTNCDGSGHCETGDCGNKIQCNGAGGAPPVSLAELTIKGWFKYDYYDISLINGYNLPMTITPTGRYVNSGIKQYDCKAAGCKADLNPICPKELAVKNSVGYTVACKSACLAFNTDEYCCRGAHNTPQTCKSTDWPINYPEIFKQACSDAYNHIYDDKLFNFTCRSDPTTTYDIVFCP